MSTSSKVGLLTTECWNCVWCCCIIWSTSDKNKGSFGVSSFYHHWSHIGYHQWWEYRWLGSHPAGWLSEQMTRRWKLGLGPGWQQFANSVIQLDGLDISSDWALLVVTNLWSRNHRLNSYMRQKERWLQRKSMSYTIQMHNRFLHPYHCDARQLCRRKLTHPFVT